MIAIVRDLILLALKMTGEYDPSERPNGEYFEESLDHLNMLFSEFSASGIDIPYIEQVEFEIQPDKDNYLFSEDTHADVNSKKIIELNFVNILFAQQSRPLDILTKAEYYDRYRSLSYKGRPTKAWLENQNYGSVLRLYPIPNSTYDCTVSAKFALDHVEMNTNLNIVPDYYKKFLLYSLARTMTDVFKSGEWTNRQEETYQRMYEKLRLANDLDLDLRLSSVLDRRWVTGNYWWYTDGNIF